MTGQFYTDTTIPVPDFENDDIGEIDVRIHYAVTSWGRRARLDGPPEDCRPAEDEEIEFLGVELIVGGSTHVPTRDGLIIGAAESWFNDNRDTLISEAREEYSGRLDYEREINAECAREVRELDRMSR